MVGMLYEYKPYLENLQIMSFARLIEAVRRTSHSVKKPSKGATGGSSSATRKLWKREREGKNIEVAMVEEPKKDYPSRKRERRDEPSPPINIPEEDFLELLSAWIKDGVVTIPPINKEPSHEERKISNFLQVSQAEEPSYHGLLYDSRHLPQKDFQWQDQVP